LFATFWNTNEKKFLESIMSNVVNFVLNGQNVSVANPDPLMSLNEYLRSTGLVGTKKVKKLNN